MFINWWCTCILCIYCKSNRYLSFQRGEWSVCCVDGGVGHPRLRVRLCPRSTSLTFLAPAVLDPPHRHVSSWPQSSSDSSLLQDNQRSCCICYWRGLRLTSLVDRGERWPGAWKEESVVSVGSMTVGYNFFCCWKGMLCILYIATLCKYL